MTVLRIKDTADPPRSALFATKPKTHKQGSDRVTRSPSLNHPTPHRLQREQPPLLSILLSRSGIARPGRAHHDRQASPHVPTFSLGTSWEPEASRGQDPHRHPVPFSKGTFYVVAMKTSCSKHTHGQKSSAARLSRMPVRSSPLRSQCRSQTAPRRAPAHHVRSEARVPSDPPRPPEGWSFVGHSSIFRLRTRHTSVFGNMMCLQVTEGSS